MAQWLKRMIGKARVVDAAGAVSPTVQDIPLPASQDTLLPDAHGIPPPAAQDIPPTTAPDVDTWLREGYASQQAGDLVAAMASYRRVIAARADHCDAHYLLGTVHRALGQWEQALAAFERAIEANPDIAVFHYDLAAVAQAQQAWPVAEAHLRTAIGLDPQMAVAHNDLGIVLKQQGKDGDDVMDAFQRAIALEPKLVPAHFNLAVEFARRARWQDAKTHFAAVNALHPDHPGCLLQLAQACRQLGETAPAAQYFADALRLDSQGTDAPMGLALLHFEAGRFADAQALYEEARRRNPGLAEAAYGLGCCHGALGRTDEALKSYQDALRSDPHHGAAHLNLGSLHFAAKRYADAIESYRRALECRPDSAQAHLNLALALSAQGELAEATRIAEAGLALEVSAPALSNLAYLHNQQDRAADALASAERAIAVDPALADAHVNRAIALERMGDLPAAMSAYDAALTIAPDSAAAHWGRGCVLLGLGDYARGWDDYEWRWKLPGFAGSAHLFAQPLWDGAVHAEATLLIHAEQGLGDTIHFARFVPLAARAFKRVILLCPAALAPLLAAIPGVEAIVTDATDVPAFDYHIGLLSLARVLGCRVETIPAAVPYLRVPTALRRQWAATIAARISAAQRTVGIVWAGGEAFKGDRHRSCAFALFEPLGALPGITLVSLQKGPRARQAAKVPAGMRLVDLAPQLTDFAATAALIDNLDLVISVDTAVAHLAGALNRPVWTLLPVAPDFRWLRDRDDSPWYPSMRLFRQRRAGDWPEVFDRLARALARWRDDTAPIAR